MELFVDEAEIVERARDAFGPAFARLERFATALARDGVRRGLIGPREVPRLWERHILNSAAVAPYLPRAGVVIDVGSGAGLPGLVLACLRPDLDVVLLEPMERRVAWLTEVAALIPAPNARVERGRAEEVQGRLVADVVTARAVAPLGRLASWTLPLTRERGEILAFKGSRAEEEVAAAAATITRLGGGPAEVLRVAPLDGLEATTIVRIPKLRDMAPGHDARPRRRRRRPG